MSKITEHTMAGQVWKERLGGWMALSISWDGSRGYKTGMPGYAVYKGAHFKDREDAAKDLVRVAKGLLEKALKGI